MSFLVAEGIPEIRESLCYILLSLGIKGIPVSSIEQALNAITRETGIDTAIIDVENTEVEGMKLINHLRNNNQTKHIKIIVHSKESDKHQGQG